MLAHMFGHSVGSGTLYPETTCERLKSRVAYEVFLFVGICYPALPAMSACGQLLAIEP